VKIPVTEQIVKYSERPVWHQQLDRRFAMLITGHILVVYLASDKEDQFLPESLFFFKNSGKEALNT